MSTVQDGWHGSDSDIATLSAIYDYIRAQRANVNRFPDLLSKIQEFESWTQGLTFITSGDVDTARRYREEVNGIMGEALPPDWTPADRPQTPPPAPGPTTTEYVGWAAVGAGVLFVISKLLRK